MSARRLSRRPWTAEEILAAVWGWLEGREAARIKDYIVDARANPDRLPSYEEQRRQIGEWHKVRLLAGWDKPVAWSSWTEERVVAALREWLSGRCRPGSPISSPTPATTRRCRRTRRSAGTSRAGERRLKLPAGYRRRRRPPRCEPKWVMAKGPTGVGGRPEVGGHLSGRT